jgi:hypothetical protein
MAVYQISKIQIRRGKANSGVEFPQLSSGEMGWAIDTQELFIGNGSVSEGAPAVGNTKILTIHDDLLTTADYSYKITSANVITGLSSNSPVFRQLQARLDDRVNVADFGAIGDGSHDDSDALNRAITQLFANLGSPAYESVPSRIELEIPAGTYKITKPIVIPSYTTLIGHGVDKTIINYVGLGTPFICKNDDTDPVSIATQPRHIKISDLTIKTSSSVSTCIDLSNVSNSEFYNLQVIGAITGTDATNVGILLNSESTVSVANNIFRNIYIKNFYYGIANDRYAFENMFDSITIANSYSGILLGNLVNSNKNQFINITLSTITQVGLYIKNGTENHIERIYLTNVGTTTPQLFFTDIGNRCVNITSNRTPILSSGLYAVQYYPEIAGNFSYTSDKYTKELQHNAGASTPLFRMPLNSNITGTPTASVLYTVDYTYISNTVDLRRQGQLTIIASTTTATVNDDYTGLGSYLTSWEKYLDITFNVVITDNTLVIMATNAISTDTGVFTYSYTATH